MRLWLLAAVAAVAATIAAAAVLVYAALDADTPSAPPAPGHQGLWISAAELAALPMEGGGWERLVAAADRIGEADIADQNSSHDIDTLAVALVAARTGDVSYRAKAIQNLMSVIGTEDNHDEDCNHRPNVARSMAVGRNLAAYVIAADLVALRPGDASSRAAAERFHAWVEEVRSRPNCPNTGSGDRDDGAWRNLGQTHEASASNGSAMAGGARLAAALYVGDTEEVERAWATFRRYAGDRRVGPSLGFNDDGLTWAHDPSAPVAINPQGSRKGGRSIDGAVVNDIGRGGEFRWPPGVTGYPWEGLQGAYVQAQLLSRAGYPAWEIEDRALLRAVEYLWYLSEETGEPAWWDKADWVKYLANSVYGVERPISGPADRGRNMAWTDWTSRAR